MGSSRADCRVSSTADEAAAECAAYILDSLREALKSQPTATLAVSGGSTPKLLFAKLAAASFDWSLVHFFWVDERCVPPTDSQSNFKLTQDALFAHASIPAANIHRIHGELAPPEGTSHYIEEIKRFFQLPNGALPAFDLLHRGIGPDAHTASLFPGDPLIGDRKSIAAPVWVEKLKSHRVTLLPGVLLAAKRTVIQAAGPDKAEAIHQVLEGPEDPFQFPCQLATRGSQNSLWFIDQAAAAKL